MSKKTLLLMIGIGIAVLASVIAFVSGGGSSPAAESGKTEAALEEAVTQPSGGEAGELPIDETPVEQGTTEPAPREAPLTEDQEVLQQEWEEMISEITGEIGEIELPEMEL